MTTTAFLFPGQGSQSLGMLADIAAFSPLVEKTYEEASHVLGYDLWTLTQQGPAEKLNQTVYTQPALLAASVALWRLWQTRHSTLPALLAGHSLGEYSALVCAKAVSFEDGIRLVAARGQFMQEAVPEGEGALAAIVGLEEEAIEEICTTVAAQTTQVLAPANFNSPGQIVISGHTKAVDEAIDLAKSRGAKLAKRLAVSAPSHCALMRPAAERLKTLLETIPIQPPAIPVIHNVDVSRHSSPVVIREMLVQQLYLPVRWSETIQSLREMGIVRAVECGPGQVLAGLNKRIDKEMSCVNILDELGIAN